jgi:hypothetical protein
MTLAQLAGRLARAAGFPGLPVLAKSILYRYRAPAGPLAALSAASLAPVERRRGTSLDLPAESPVYQHWHSEPGGHKWLHYFEQYDALFATLRGRPIRLLEIGVYRGASLRTWRKFLHPDSVIVGIDIDPSCAAFDGSAPNVHVRLGSQADRAFLAEVTREFGPFDVILDDGSHMNSHMIASFDGLFLPALADDGLYIAEDTHGNFWGEFRDQRYSFIDLCKDLVDVMHSHYPKLDAEIAFRADHADQARALSVPRLAAQIREISFRDSIVVIRKQPVGRLPASVHN